MSLIASVVDKLRRERVARDIGARTPLVKAVQWIKSQRAPNGGILCHHKAEVATQEVTGYLIPTLLRLGEKEFARGLAKWEAYVQRPDGAFVAPDGIPYTFDTAQVIRGFLAVLDDMPELENSLRRACDFVDGQIGTDGKVHTPSYDMWKMTDGSVFSEYANLYVLPPMFHAGQKLSEERYIDAAKRGLNYFKSKSDLIEFKPALGTLSHIFGYMMEALVEVGEIDLATEGLRQVERIQRENGAIPAHPGVDWICSTGMAQVAVAWYKLGNTVPADKAVRYLEGIQNPSGGFYGSYGVGATYFPDEEIPWAVKFFLDCLLQGNAHQP